MQLSPYPLNDSGSACEYTAGGTGTLVVTKPGYQSRSVDVDSCSGPEPTEQQVSVALQPD